MSGLPGLGSQLFGSLLLSAFRLERLAFAKKSRSTMTRISMILWIRIKKIMKRFGVALDYNYRLSNDFRMLRVHICRDFGYFFFFKFPPGVLVLCPRSAGGGQYPWEIFHFFDLAALRDATPPALHPFLLRMHPFALMPFLHASADNGRKPLIPDLSTESCAAFRGARGPVTPVIYKNKKCLYLNGDLGVYFLFLI
jgi:hypothetical protein